MGENQRKHAGVYLTHLVTNALIDKGRSLRTTELQQLLGDDISARLIRHELWQRRERFVFSQRHWDLYWRQAAQMSPLSGIVEAVVEQHGPLTSMQVSEYVAPCRDQDPRVLVSTITDLLENRPRVFLPMDEGQFGVTDWCLDLDSDEEEEIIADNFFGDEEEITALMNRVRELGPDWNQPLSTVFVRIIDALGQPLSYREASLLIWRYRREELETVEGLRQLLVTADLSNLSLGYLCTLGVERLLKDAIRQRSEDVQRESLLEVAGTDLPSLLRRVSSDNIEPLSNEEVLDIADWMRQKGGPVELGQVMAEVLELSTSDDEFAQSLASLQRALDEGDQFQSLSGNRWCVAEVIPEDVTGVPVALIPTPVPPAPLNIEGQTFDLELEDAGLEVDLVDWVNMPKYEDVREELMKAPPLRKSRSFAEIPVAYHHITEGVLRLRQTDAPLFGSSPKVQYLEMNDSSTGAFPVWVNLETGIIHGLTDWYSLQEVTSGTIVRIQKKENNGFDILVKPRGEKQLRLGQNRLDELLQWRETLQDAPIVTLLQILMPQHHYGIHFIQLCAEVNVVRRTSKRVVASLLSAYPFFVRKEGKQPIWLFDVEKASEGVRHEKLRFMRVTPGSSGVVAVVAESAESSESASGEVKLTDLTPPLEGA